MANMHLVTGYANKEHIKSADQGSFNAAMLGEGEFVLERGNKFASTIISNNIVRIKDGDILMQGRHIRLEDGSYIDLDFENGQQGFKRNDLIVVRYTKDSATGVEETNLVVIKGTPTTGNATDPEITQGDIINDHVLVNDMPLYRVPFDGLNIQNLVCLFEVLPSWKTLKAQAVEETQTAIQTAAEQKLDQAINVIEEQMNEVVAEAEDAVARVLAVKQGTTDPTKTTVGILGQIYINTASKKIFHCVAVASGNYTWVGDVLPELIVTTEKGVTVTVTNGVITYSATSNGKATFTVPNYGKWTVSATINGTVISKVVDVTEAKQIPVLLDYQTMTAVINLSNSNPATCVSYADDAVGMTAEQWDEFFGHYPVLFKDGKEVGRLDRNNFSLFEDGSLADIESGKSGDVMIAFPRRGLKITKSGTTTVTISMTNDPDNPDFKYYAHQRGSVKKNVFYIGAFKGYKDGDNKLRSLTGKKPTANITIGTARTYAHNNGSGYEQSAFYQLLFRQCAYIMKFGSLNSQTKVGKGVVSRSYSEGCVNTGGSNTYGMDCEIIKASNPSYMTDGKHQVKCLGIEDFWGNIFEWIDGLVTDSSNPINILTNTDNFQDNGMGAGYMTTSSGMSSGNGGYMKEPQGSTETGFTFKASGGSSTTYFTDSAYLDGGYVASFGGSWYDGGSAGAFRLDVAYSASGSYDDVSARLMYL